MVYEDWFWNHRGGCCDDGGRFGGYGNNVPAGQEQDERHREDAQECRGPSRMAEGGGRGRSSAAKRPATARITVARSTRSAIQGMGKADTSPRKSTVEKIMALLPWFSRAR